MHNSRPNGNSGQDNFSHLLSESGSSYVTNPGVQAGGYGTIGEEWLPFRPGVWYHRRRMASLQAGDAAQRMGNLIYPKPILFRSLLLN